MLYFYLVFNWVGQRSTCAVSGFSSVYFLWFAFKFRKYPFIKKISTINCHSRRALHITHTTQKKNPLVFIRPFLFAPLFAEQKYFAFFHILSGDYYHVPAIVRWLVSLISHSHSAPHTHVNRRIYIFHAVILLAFWSHSFMQSFLVSFLQNSIRPNSGRDACDKRLCVSVWAHHRFVPTINHARRTTSRRRA